MSKPIRLTEELLAQISNEFLASLKSMKMFDGKINYTKTFKWNEAEKATVTFLPAAFAKMITLVQSFDSEVAWHGVAIRDSTQKNRFFISDIIVYPQVVSGSTVNTDQEEYTKWLYGLEDGVFNNIRMQGHSHVNFGTTPSAVDLSHQEKILAQLDDDMFYIFMIWNKKLERTIRIFDLANNTLYENDDVSVVISGDGNNLDEFLSDAKSLVKKAPAQPMNPVGFAQGNGYYAPQGTYQQPQKKETSKTKVEPAQKSKSKGNAKGSIGSSYKSYSMGGYGFLGDDYDDSWDRFYR